MAYIAPNSLIHILTNVPLDASYTNTLYFAGTSTQYNYFTSKIKYSFGENSYQRVGINAIRLQIPVDALYDCNYLMFNNTSYSGKWFYAFITDVEYVNNAVSIIYYKIDVMQTWLPGTDYETGMWFVVREHSVNDTLFENTQPENLELGTNVVANGFEELDLSDLDVCMLTSMNADGDLPEAHNENNTIISLHRYLGDIDYGIRAVNSIIDAGYEDGIIAMYMFPAKLYPANVTANGANYYMEQFTFSPNLTSLDGYTPKNKKLFTHPYNYLSVSNNLGETADYKYENFNHNLGYYAFMMMGAYLTNPIVLLYPRNHRNITEDYDNGITMSNFPTCAISGDAFKAWWAQNKGSIISGTITSAVSSLFTGSFSFTGHRNDSEYGGQAYNEGIYPNRGGSISQYGGANQSINVGRGYNFGVNPVGAILSVASSVGNTLGKKRDLENTPPKVHGQVHCDSLNAGSKRYKFTFYKYSIKAEYAKIIDDYFSMYGYATNKVKSPNISSRPYWNYVQTANAYVTGDLPQDYANEIAAIFNKGITFWKDASYVGRYNLDNRPQS